MIWKALADFSYRLADVVKSAGVSQSAFVRQKAGQLRTVGHEMSAADELGKELWRKSGERSRELPKLPLKPDLIMRLGTVNDIASKYDIDIRRYKIRLEKGTVGLGMGRTISPREIILYPEAFRKGREYVRNGSGKTVYLSGEARLARTLYHETFHAQELASGVRLPRTEAELEKYEDRAWAAEAAWWKNIGQYIADK
ncbi:hypothetical protein AB0B25_31300 [Nocardia sp. NPDC049190]|uniref:hypothetical protein n=1 Tax=Nocardia sp. NPDC049190 TaxID=3155650 RepID=UPI0033E9CCFC